MEFHPQDTVRIYKSRKDQTEHLWYHIHYFQTRSTDEKANKRLKEAKAIPDSSAIRSLLERIIQRRESHLAEMSTLYEVKILSGVPTSNLSIGTGAAHIRESSLTLHPIYGIPYIPGSSIKGTLRSWVLQAFFHDKSPLSETDSSYSEEQQYVRKIFLDLFGSAEYQGRMQFYDAYPYPNFYILPDVLTVHFKDYYEEKKMATDNQTPVPVHFYTVNTDTFQFVLTIKKEDPSQSKSGLTTSQLSDIAVAWLEKTLTEHGIGAKTTSGYGYFSHLDDHTEKSLQEHRERLRVQEKEWLKNLEEKKRAEEEKKRQEALVRKLAAMSPVEKLTYEIKTLETNQSDQDRSKSALFNQVVQMAQQGEKEPLFALKEYWEKIGAWKAKKKSKQFDKIKTLKAFLKEQK